MSMNSELRVRLERLAPVRDAGLPRSFSDERVVVALHRQPGSFHRAVAVAQRLRTSGLSLRAAHAAITELATDDRALCEIPIDGGIDDLARDLAALGVDLRRRRSIADPAAFIAEIRTRHGLSQQQFAGALGLDSRTLQNWEQGRNRPDAAVLSLVALFDRDPGWVESVIFERVT